MGEKQGKVGVANKEKGKEGLVVSLEGENR